MYPCKLGRLLFDESQKPIAGMKREIERDVDSAEAAKLMKSAVSYSGVLELPAGNYEVVFAVRDNASGRVGSVLASLRLNGPSDIPTK